MQTFIHHPAVITFLLAWLWTEIEPIMYLMVKIEERLPRFLKFTVQPLQCFPCLTLWSILVVTFNPLYALLGAFIAAWYEREQRD